MALELVKLNGYRTLYFYLDSSPLRGVTNPKSEGHLSAPEGLSAPLGNTVSEVAALILHQHYSAYNPIPERYPEKAARDKSIRERYAAGENIQNLAEKFGVSIKRIYQIILQSC